MVASQAEQNRCGGGGGGGGVEEEQLPLPMADMQSKKAMHELLSIFV